MNAASIDGITIDAYGTLATLSDPLPRLQELLPDHGRSEIASAFRAEAAFYRGQAARGRDPTSLRELRDACVGVFNDELGSSLSSVDYVSALAFEPLPGIRDELERLRSMGFALAVVANWDFSLHERLVELELASFFATVVPAANKPSPDGILAALRTLGVQRSRALHIGDDATDAAAADAAGVAFLPAPLEEAVASLG